MTFNQVKKKFLVGSVEGKQLKNTFNRPVSWRTLKQQHPSKELTNE